mmetsp:Transcript_31072/g.63051  ORF Transcript_31072/g.63051 Transcript_31072/m.63051 type:complete len:208 (-) Transcript_31072:197-820(-)
MRLAMSSLGRLESDAGQQLVASIDQRHLATGCAVVVTVSATVVALRFLTQVSEERWALIGERCFRMAEVTAPAFVSSVGLSVGLYRGLESVSVGLRDLGINSIGTPENREQVGNAIATLGNVGDGLRNVGDGLATLGNVGDGLGNVGNGIATLGYGMKVLGVAGSLGAIGSAALRVAPVIGAGPAGVMAGSALVVVCYLAPSQWLSS